MKHRRYGQQGHRAENPDQAEDRHQEHAHALHGNAEQPQDIEPPSKSACAAWAQAGSSQKESQTGCGHWGKLGREPIQRGNSAASH